MAKIRESALIEGLSGRIGNRVMVPMPSGTIVRGRPRYKRPLTEVQIAANERLALIAKAWNELTPEQADAWRKFAKSLARRDQFTMTNYPSTAYMAFSQLSLKFAQMHPGQPLPTHPPTEPFDYELPTVTVTPTPGGILWHSTTPNLPGNTTELLIEHLANPRRSPKGRPNSLCFHQFTVAQPTVQTLLEPGTYVAYERVCHLASGQSWGLEEIGLVTVS